jgi:hypothetical protein
MFLCPRKPRNPVFVIKSVEDIVDSIIKRSAEKLEARLR